MDGYSRFRNEVDGVLTVYPDLKFAEVDNIPTLSGSMAIYSDNDEYIDSYQIEIRATEDYPSKYPQVFETGGRLPHNIDWHIYGDGHWCIGVGVEEAIKCSQGITLVSFISNQIRSFLFNQTYRKINGVFYRERSHGIKGVLEYYMETLSLSTYSIVYDALYAATQKEPKSNSKCFCRSNRKYHKCHRKPLRFYRKHAQYVMNNDYNKLKELIEKKQ